MATMRNLVSDFIIASLKMMNESISAQSVNDFEHALMPPENKNQNKSLVRNIRTTSSSNSHSIICFILGLAYAVTFPIIFFDFYFALSDHSCVHQKTTSNGMRIDMYVYLLVSATYSATILMVLSVGILCATELRREEQMDCINYIGGFIILFNGICTTAWTIVGAVIFWHFIDSSQCNTNVYNYLYISLLIKLIGVAGTLCNWANNRQ